MPLTHHNPDRVIMGMKPIFAGGPLRVQGCHAEGQFDVDTGDPNFKFDPTGLPSQTQEVLLSTREHGHLQPLSRTSHLAGLSGIRKQDDDYEGNRVQGDHLTSGVGKPFNSMCLSRVCCGGIMTSCLIPPTPDL